MDEEFAKKRTILRNRLRKLLGIPLNNFLLQAKIIERKIEKDYICEEIMYLSKSGEVIPATLRIPQKVHFPCPAILCLHEHTGGCKGGRETVEYFSKELTEIGYITFAFDSKCFGERRNKEYDNIEDDWQNNVFWSERVVAMNAILKGETLLGYMLGDIIMAVDYLRTRKEVDSKRVGSIGHSMGGILTWWAMALDNRIKAGVASCAVSSYKEILNKNQVHALFMYVPGLLKAGDVPQIISLIAPRPFLMLNAERDASFPLEGLKEVYSEGRKAYKIFSAENRLKKIILQGGHKFTLQMRHEAYKWFERWL